MNNVTTCRLLQNASVIRPFSTYFKELDKASMEKMKWEMYRVPEYAKLDDGWRKPLAAKKAKRARQLEREAAQEPI